MTAPDRDRLTASAGQLRHLHQEGLLVLPNAWDVASARVVEEAGFAAVATSSAAVTAVLGLPDGEGAPWQEVFAATARIARAVWVPVTMDAEGGYGMTPSDLVGRLLDIGVAGCNLEDSDHRSGGLKDPQRQADFLAGVRNAADAVGVPLVINARVDTFLPTSGIRDDGRVAETVRRGRLYRAAGADCVYPIGVSAPAVLAELVAGIDAPINANSGPHLSLPVLKDLRVARVSFGPRFYRTALADFRAAIQTLAG